VSHLPEGPAFSGRKENFAKRKFKQQPRNIYFAKPKRW